MLSVVKFFPSVPQLKVREGVKRFRVPPKPPRDEGVLTRILPAFIISAKCSANSLFPVNREKV
jgi:hypothetical protein